MKVNIFLFVLYLLLAIGCKNTTTPKEENLSTQKITKPCDGYNLSLKDALQQSKKPCSVFISNVDDFPIELNNLLNLEELTLHNCSIDSFPDNFAHNSKLKALMIGSMSVLPSQIDLLNHLEVLYLAKNTIPNIEDKLCNMSNLKALHLIDNKENSDSLFSCIGRFKNLETFYLGASNIQRLPKEFGE